jgi:hypothetical protein
MIASVATRWREELPYRDHELAGLHHPLPEALRPVRKRSLVELTAHLLSLARLQVYLGEPLELSQRPRNRRLDVSDVDLDNLCPCPLTGVGD